MNGACGQEAGSAVAGLGADPGGAAVAKDLLDAGGKPSVAESEPDDQPQRADVLEGWQRFVRNWATEHTVNWTRL
jgi:hypothetical protein